MRDLLVETASRVFADHQAPPGRANEGDVGDFHKLWSALTAAGITQALHPAMGGEISLGDAGAMLRPAAYHAAAVPLAGTLLAQWLLAAAGCAVPDTPLTVVPRIVGVQTGAGGHRLSGDLSRIPWLRRCSHVVVPFEINHRLAVALIPVAACMVAEGQNLAGEPRDTIVKAPAIAEYGELETIAGADLAAVGAAFLSIQIAGALDHVLALTLRYVQDRVQFGKPLAKLQAVQQLCATLAGHCAAATAAADLAIDALDAGVDKHRIAAAKVRSGEAAGCAAAIAHQLHGAMGVTREHALHRYTRRLWSWRDEYGSEAYWSAWLGRKLIEDGAQALWPAITKAA